MAGPSFGDVATGSGGVHTPFAPQFFNVTQGFNPPNEWGVDYALPQGTPIYATADGTVHINTNWTNPGHPVGWALTLDWLNGWSSLYGHISKFAVSNGQRVHAGDLLGFSGGTPGTPGAGDSTGAHIEYQLINPQGQRVDPTNFLSQLMSDSKAVAGETQTGNAQVSDLPGSNVLPAAWTAATAIPNAVIWVFSHKWQMLFVLAGGVMVLAGGLLFFREEGGAKVTVQTAAKEAVAA